MRMARTGTRGYWLLIGRAPTPLLQRKAINNCEQIKPFFLPSGLAWALSASGLALAPSASVSLPLPPSRFLTAQPVHPGLRSFSFLFPCFFSFLLLVVSRGSPSSSDFDSWRLSHTTVVTVCDTSRPLSYLSHFPLVLVGIQFSQSRYLRFEKWGNYRSIPCKIQLVYQSKDTYYWKKEKNRISYDVTLMTKFHTYRYFTGD